ASCIGCQVGLIVKVGVITVMELQRWGCWWVAFISIWIAKMGLLMSNFSHLNSSMTASINMAIKFAFGVVVKLGPCFAQVRACIAQKLWICCQ
ncbi:hypothetical protein U1Q18_017598, partial [Sarracenia purpurea var. burkii]